ncbi:hypothetical protein GJAV_G00116700 [Gymnothorax javanicus]|nr:hypothetical protein GJAV_G00116700 [Gymnothorax javanicus]
MCVLFFAVRRSYGWCGYLVFGKNPLKFSVILSDKLYKVYPSVCMKVKPFAMFVFQIFPSVIHR